MLDWKTIKVTPEETLKKVVGVLEDGGVRFAVVTNSDDQLVGTVTDGDIRRGLIKGIGLSGSVKDIMNNDPFYLEEENENLSITEMEKRCIFHVPIVSKDKTVIKVVIHDSIISSEPLPNVAVIMAGGMGKRLGTLTENTPKPLLKVGEKPILHTIIESLKENGIRNIYLSVNYKSEMIKEFFKDGSELNVNIKYINEEKPLGTAGSLSFLPKTINEPIIVMNGDLLTKINFRDLLNYHNENDSCATMCVREYDFKVPYGVISTEGTEIKKIIEKPVQKFFVNAGVYVLDSNIFKELEPGEHLDMTTLFNNLIDKKIGTSVFPLREYWIDVGQLEDFKKANHEYSENFEC